VHDEVIVIFFSSKQAGWLFLCILFYTVVHRKVPRPAKGQKITKRICDNFNFFQIKSIISALSPKRGGIKKRAMFLFVFWGTYVMEETTISF
jgi:hypothetical protein